MGVFVGIPEDGEERTYITRSSGGRNVVAEIYPPSEESQKDDGAEFHRMYVTSPGNGGNGVYIDLKDLRTVLRHAGYTVEIAYGDDVIK